jgi:predicted small secreted protein
MIFVSTIVPDRFLLEDEMKLNVSLALIAISLTLSGCETMNSIGKSLSAIQMPKISAASTVPKEPSLVASADVSCPKAMGMPELSSISQFSDTKTMSPSKLIASAKLENVDAKCQIGQTGVTVELDLDFSGLLGPVGVKDLNGQASYAYPYFLTVITPDGTILSKDVFALSMVYEKGQINIRKQDKLRQIIPLMPGQKADQFQIIVGFQLSEDELAYNRRAPR